jgi:hypothetical protein
MNFTSKVLISTFVFSALSSVAPQVFAETGSYTYLTCANQDGSLKRVVLAEKAKKSSASTTLRRESEAIWMLNNEKLEVTETMGETKILHINSQYQTNFQNGWPMTNVYRDIVAVNFTLNVTQDGKTSETSQWVICDGDRVESNNRGGKI